MVGPYIEQDDSSVQIPANTGLTIDQIESSENTERWKWLTEGWATMTFSEKLDLFQVQAQYMYIRPENKAGRASLYPDVVSNRDQLHNEIKLSTYELCRNVKDIKFCVDNECGCTVLVLYEPINPDLIPNTAVKNAVKTFKSTYVYPPIV